MFHRCRVRVAILARLWVQLFLVVFDPIGDAQEDPQSMQMVRVLVVRLGHSDQHLFGLGLAQDTRERLQKHLQVTFIQNMHIICLSHNSKAPPFSTYLGIKSKVRITENNVAVITGVTTML